MKLTVLIAAVLGVAGVGRSSAPSCSAPAPEQSIAWDKLDGEWYVMLDQAVGIEREYGCFSFSNIRQTVEGFSHLLSLQGSNAKTGYGLKIPIQATADGSGRFVWDYGDMSLQVLAQWFRSQVPSASDSDVQAEVSWTNHGFVYHTDYDNYIIEMACAEDGSKHLWVYFRNIQPEAEDILRVHNKLVDIGCGWSGIRLSPAPCWLEATA